MRPITSSGTRIDKRASDALERVPQSADGMTHRNVETLIGRLATDPGLRRRFAEDPDGTLQELRDEGFELTRVELEALASTDADALRSFADTLDRRIRRAAKEGEPV